MSGGSHCPLSSSSSSMYYLWQWHPILHTLNSLWPSDAIWRCRSMSTLAQVMACCLTAPSHYLNQCWHTINKVQWHSSDGNFTRYTSTIDHWVLFENYLCKLSFECPMGQWVKEGLWVPVPLLTFGFDPKFDKIITATLLKNLIQSQQNFAHTKSVVVSWCV